MTTTNAAAAAVSKPSTHTIPTAAAAAAAVADNNKKADAAALPPQPPNALQPSAADSGSGSRLLSDKFIFPNGDVYDGEFTYNAATNEPTRHGTGTYYLSNGAVLHGQWAHDKLNGFCRVRFAAGASPAACHYEGPMRDNKFHGVGGRLTLADGSVLKATFAHNRVIDEGYFLDQRGITWKGNFETLGALNMPMRLQTTPLPLAEKNETFADDARRK